MATATLESFKAELERLVDKFSQGERTFKHKDYLEDRVRTDFLDPFIRALGWDRDGTKNQPEKLRDVESESGVRISGNKKRADYLFRTNGNSQFICEAKKPNEELDPHAWQAKRYAWSAGLAIATLSDFEDFHIYVVGAEPKKNEPAVGQYKIWNYKKYIECAEELWDLFSYENVKSGSLERLVEGLPKKARGKKQGRYAIKPDRTKTVDKVFLSMLEKSRLELGKNIFKNNGGKVVFEHNQINESVQRILDRILFLRFCEARGIETGQTLESICDKSQHAIDGTSAYEELAKHFQKLGKPTSNVPFFNGNLFSKHFSQALTIDNKWLLEFIDNLSGEKSPYLFEVMPIEILGSIYEQFLGKELIAKGSGVAVDQKKTTVKKDTGVYYTPRYIVDYIVEQTLGKQLSEIANGNGQRPSLKDFEKQTSALKVLDPACGSGSFLIRAFERICEHWERRLKDDLPLKDAPNRAAWEKEHRTRCYIDPQRDAVFLTVGLKKKILLDNIYGVDIDPAAVEVTQLSLYLKMLEHETKTTLVKQKDLFPSDIAILPALKDNIKCGNSLISSDFSALPEDLTRVQAFDWSVQFEAIMKDRGFDTVIGNPPYLASYSRESVKMNLDEKAYFSKNYCSISGRINTFVMFAERGINLLREFGRLGFIVPKPFLNMTTYTGIRNFLLNHQIERIVLCGEGVFQDASVPTSIVIVTKGGENQARSSIQISRIVSTNEHRHLQQISYERVFKDPEHRIKAEVDESSDTLLAKISANGKALGDFAKVEDGINPGPFRKVLVSTEKNTNSCVKLIEGKNFSRYSPIVWSGKFFNWDKVLVKKMQPKHPNSIAVLGDEGRFLAREKIVTRQTAAGIIATFDTNKFFSTNSVHTTRVLAEKSDLNTKFILGVLNSSLLDFFFRLSFKDKDGAFPQVKVNKLRTVPCFSPNLNQPTEKLRHDKLVQLVDKMLDLTSEMQAAKSETKKATLQNAITATDHEIDRLVYEMYGLTEDEIKLVEESSANNK